MARIPAYQYGGVVMRCDKCGEEWELYKGTYCPRCGSALSTIAREKPMEVERWKT